MTQSDRDFVAQIFAGSIAGAPALARPRPSFAAWFSTLALGAVVLGAALGFAV